MHITNRILLLVVTIFMISGAQAQDRNQKNKTPQWVSEKGFWQIETNVRFPDRNIVYFYTNDHVLVYKENVNGVMLDLKKKSVKMRLKKALEKAVIAWQQDRQYQTDRQWVSLLFTE